MNQQAQIETVAVVGLGLLGRGIASCLLAGGLKVIGQARRRETHDAAMAYIEHGLNELVAHRVIEAPRRDDWRKRYTAVDRVEDVAGADFVIESVFEDLAVKREVFDGIESAVGPDVPVASNTSALPITLLQSDRKHPQRFIGMHWAEPCHLTRFLELICGDRTSEATLDAAMRLGKLTGKEPAVVRRDIEGFIANRLGYALYREAFNLLELGIADVETIDRSFRNALGLYATFCGPFRWMDLTGLPAYAKVMERLFPQLSTTTALPERMRALIESGAEGIRTRRGFYDYTDEEVKRWEKLLLEHAWSVRELADKYYPLDQP